MIESHFWRQELRADLSWLRRHRRFTRWSEKQQVLFERRLMLVAFQIRVLIERPVLSERVRSAHVDAHLYPKVGDGPVTLLNATALEEHFDLDNPAAIRLSIRDLCNQLIHHYVLFALRGTHRHFETVFVFSDYKKHVGLYAIQVDQTLALFSLFASELSAATSVRMTWDEKRKDYSFSTEP